MHDMIEALLVVLAFFHDFDLLWICLLQLLSNLVQSDDIERLLSVCAAHQDIGKLMVVLKLGPKVVNYLMPTVAVQEWLVLFDDWYHLFSEKSVC